MDWLIIWNGNHTKVDINNVNDNLAWYSPRWLLLLGKLPFLWLQSPLWIKQSTTIFVFAFINIMVFKGRVTRDLMSNYYNIEQSTQGLLPNDIEWNVCC